jgi:hypothetical protein
LDKSPLTNIHGNQLSLMVRYEVDDTSLADQNPCELKSYVLIEIYPKASDVEYGLVKITKEGLQLLQDQHLKSDMSD